MANSLNVRLVNEVSTIAQGDNASTVVVELLDENRLIMPSLNGKDALINFIDSKGEIQYQVSTVIFDSRIEFNIDSVINHGKYFVEIRVSYEGYSYVFPSSVDYVLRINRSANDYYNRAIETSGIEVVTRELYEKLESENPGLLDHVSRKDNPHDVTKEQIGLGNVDDIKQATKSEFDEHVSDDGVHVTTEDRERWDGKATQEDIEDAITNADFPDTEKIDSHISDTSAHFVDEEKQEITETIRDLESQIDSLKETIEELNGGPVEDTPLELTSGIEGATFYGTSAFIRNKVAYITTLLIMPDEGSLSGTTIRVAGVPDGLIFANTYGVCQVDEGSSRGTVFLTASGSGTVNSADIEDGLKHNAGYLISLVVPLVSR